MYHPETINNGHSARQSRLTLIALITAFILATLALFVGEFDVRGKVLMTGAAIVVIGVWILAQRLRLLRKDMQVVLNVIVPPLQDSSGDGG